MGTKNGKELTDKYVSNFKSMDPDMMFREVSERFGTQTLVKEAVISELKKKGYNAMIDQASVGGSYKPIEGYAPIIVFDRGLSLDKMASKKISRKTMDAATKRYFDWRNKVNDDLDCIEQW